MPKLNSPIHPRARDNKVVLGHDPDGCARIRGMLSDLWSEMRATDGDHPSFHRVCLTNLVVIGPIAEQPALESFAAAFASSHPSRVILAVVDPAAEEMSASISASCQRSPSGGDVVCWEKILINVPDSCDSALTSVVRALLMGRVATVAIVALPADAWPVLIRGVEAWGDLLVSDSSCSLTRELLYWDRNGDSCGHPRWIERLWESIKPIRLALARDYEAEGETHRWMEEANEIECAAPNPSVCRLVLGWVASRMGWVLLGPGIDDHSVLIRRPSGIRASIKTTTADKLAIRYFDANGLRHETVIDPVQGADWGLAWDDPQWPGIVIQAMHSIRSDHVFFSAADAASQIERIQSGIKERLRLTVARDAADLADKTAARFAELADTAIRDRGRFLVALAGGSTPEALYRRLTASPFRESVEWEKIEWFWGDERWVPHDDPQSNYRMARQALLDHLPVLPDRIHPIPTHRASVIDAAEDYETTIRGVSGTTGDAAPIFDLILLGIGPDGHTASWFPDAPLDAAVRGLVWGGYIPVMEAQRVTLTPRVIGSARCALFLVSGSGKANIVARTLYPPWQARHPAARVTVSDGVIEWFVDAAAAAEIDPADFS